MNPHSAKALAWLTAILILLALVILSPGGAFALLGAAALCAAIPAVFATGRLRLISLALLLVSVALMASFYPAYKREREAYGRRVRARPENQQVPASPDQGRGKPADDRR